MPTARALRHSVLVLCSGVLVGSLGSASLHGQAKPAPAKPAQARSAQPPPPAPALPPGPTQGCQYITPDEAKGLLGAEATSSNAPSKGLFTSCGYTSPSGDALTVYLSDYGLPSVAKQFFDKTRESLKTAANEETLGVPAFSQVTPPAPAAAPAAAAPAGAAASGSAATSAPTGWPGVVTLLALKDHQTIKLEAAGPLAGQAHQLQKLRVIAARLIASLPPYAPPPEPK